MQCLLFVKCSIKFFTSLSLSLPFWFIFCNS
jgi:hypothetical protein